MMRNFKVDPYRHDEQRVVTYLHEVMPEIGAGDDPIGFLIASHASLRERVKEFRNAYEDILDDDPNEPW
jgi:DNA-binding phage protein